MTFSPQPPSSSARCPAWKPTISLSLHGTQVIPTFSSACRRRMCSSRACTRITSIFCLACSYLVWNHEKLWNVPWKIITSRAARSASAFSFAASVFRRVATWAACKQIFHVWTRIHTEKSSHWTTNHFLGDLAARLRRHTPRGLFVKPHLLGEALLAAGSIAKSTPHCSLLNWKKKIKLQRGR